MSLLIFQQNKIKQVQLRKKKVTFLFYRKPTPFLFLLALLLVPSRSLAIASNKTTQHKNPSLPVKYKLSVSETLRIVSAIVLSHHNLLRGQRIEHTVFWFTKKLEVHVFRKPKLSLIDQYPINPTVISQTH